MILRRLRKGPLTEFELAAEIAEHSGFTNEQAVDSLPVWLEELRSYGLLWSGPISNNEDQTMLVAALTKQGRELVGM